MSSRPTSPLPDARSTHMFLEAQSTAEVIAGQLAANEALMQQLARELRNREISAIVTCARGSSDHAASFAKYLFETRLGLLTSSAAPSVTSIYGARPTLAKGLYIAISQSGKSPDLLACVRQAREAGALTLALVNQEDSPLAQLADRVIPLRAGPEQSVAATKSFLASLSALLQLVAHWGEDKTLKSALADLPSALARAWELDWHRVVQCLTPACNMFIIGRGLGLGAAQEAALKLKETCGLHAEAFSSAEVKHGPMALVKEGFPVLVFGQNDGAGESMSELVADFRARGAELLLAGEQLGEENILPVVSGVHPALAPLLAVQSFYRMANSLALARGYNPDQPPHLRKVTETL
jgi:glucosamine--fructose-6-phosphate aminotransferase (isomerizing)